MRRLFLLLPIALLVPAYAQASELADVIATTIAYAKWIIMLVAMALLFKLVVKLSSGERVKGTYWAILAATSISSIILSVADRLGIQSISTSDIAAAGRPYVEYMLAHAGLLDASILSNTGHLNIAAIAVVYAAAGTVFVKGFINSTQDDDSEFRRGVYGYFIPVVFVLAFNPWWQEPATNNAQQLIGSIKAQAGTASSPDGLSLPGPMPSTSTVLPKVANATTQMIPVPNGTSTKVPVMLSVANTAMDEFVGSIVDLVAAKGFAQFGMAGVQGMLDSVKGSLPKWIAPNLRQRLMMFTNLCTNPLLQDHILTNPEAAKKWATDPQAMASQFDPFAKSNLQWFNKQPGLHACSLMIAGGYDWSPAAPDTVTSGVQFPLGIREEILANAALADPRVRQDFPQMKTVKDAAGLMPQIKNMYSDWENMVTEIYDRAILASYARQSAGLSAGGPDNSGLDGLAKDIESRVFQAYNTATQAGAAEQIQLEMPVWMGLIQYILLALFPLVFLTSLLPGEASRMGYYILTLFWAKSYVIAWALISNFDHWQSTALSYAGSSVSAGNKLAIIHTIQYAQMGSPLIMLFIFFGIKKIGAIAMAKVGGG